jgi:hypothetical protein
MRVRAWTQQQHQSARASSAFQAEAHFEKALQPPAWNVRLFLKIESKQMLEWCAR